jgi:hypothetical protein
MNSIQSEKIELFVTQKFVTSLSMSTHDLWDHHHHISSVLKTAYQRLLSWYFLQWNRILWWSNSTNERTMIQFVDSLMREQCTDVFVDRMYHKMFELMTECIVKCAIRKHFSMLKKTVSKRFNVKALRCETWKFDNYRMQRIFYILSEAINLKQLTQHSDDKISFFADQLFDENRLRKRFLVTRIFTFRAYTMLRDMKFNLELRA